jgi:RNA polymerase sigma factor (sigma-70 family)
MTAALRSKLRTFTRNWEDAHDLYQEVFVKLGNHRLDSLPAARKFIWRVTENIGIDWIRRQRRRPIDAEVTISELEFDPPDSSKSPEELLYAQQLRSRIQRIHARLPPRWRARARQ